MAYNRPPAPPAPQPFLIMPSALPVQLPVPPLQPIVPPAQPIPTQLFQPQLNWSHFKPEYVGKPDEDAEVHLLRKVIGCQSLLFLFNISRRS